MSLDNSYWVPAGARSRRKWTKYNNGEKMPHQSKHQVHLAYGIDTQFLFEDADDARWFWNEGYKLVVNKFDSITLWIDGKEIETKLDNVS